MTCSQCPHCLAEIARLDGELAKARAELLAIREVADPDREMTELSTRDCVMHIGEQAALLASVNRMCEKRGAERDEAVRMHEYTRERLVEANATSERTRAEVSRLKAGLVAMRISGWDIVRVNRAVDALLKESP